MDDGSLVGSPEHLKVAWNILAKDGPPLGLYLNPKKCEWIWLSDHKPTCPIPSPVVAPSNEFVMLGAPIGGPEFCASFIKKKYNEFSVLLKKLPDLEHSQGALLLLRHCLSFCRTVHFARSVPLSHHGSSASSFDKSIRLALESVLGRAIPNPSYTQATLGTRLGGLGLRLVTKHASGAFMASLNQSSAILTPHIMEILYSKYLPSALDDYMALAPQAPNPLPFDQCALSSLIDEHTLSVLITSLDPIDRKRLECVSTKGAGCWLNAPPQDFLGLEMNSQEFQIAVSRWLGCPVALPNTSCVSCTNPLSPKAGHTLRCKSGGYIIARHNRVRDLVHSLSLNAALSPVLEKSHILGDCPGQRPADIFLPTFYNGAPAAIDVAITDPLQDKYKKVENPAEDYAQKVKHHKYDKGFDGSEITFVPLVADTFNRWNVEGQELLQEIFRRGANRLSLPHSSYVP